MTRNVIRRIGKDSEERACSDEHIQTIYMIAFNGSSHHWNDTIDRLRERIQLIVTGFKRELYLLNYSETISIIAMEYVRSHESKDRHDVQEHCVGS